MSLNFIKPTALTLHGVPNRSLILQIGSLGSAHQEGQLLVLTSDHKGKEDPKSHIYFRIATLSVSTENKNTCSMFSFRQTDIF